MLTQIGIGFAGQRRPLAAAHITARGLHGVLYEVLKRHSERGATWLHQHAAPKPYTLAPYYDTETQTLAGIHLNVMSAAAAELLYESWEQIRQRGHTLKLGQQSFCVTNLALVPGLTFAEMAALPAAANVSLRFVSPTTFRQGSGFLPLPLPVNVFAKPYQTWQAYAPEGLQAPGDWLDWCAENVFVRDHQIETVTVALGGRAADFTGFVGDVSFRARSQSLLYLSTWQALAALAPYAGVGYKTTMGMGAVVRP